MKLQTIEVQGLRQLQALYSREWPKYIQEFYSLKNMISFLKRDPEMKHLKAYTLQDKQAQELGLYLIVVFISERLCFNKDFIRRVFRIAINYFWAAWVNPLLCSSKRCICWTGPRASCARLCLIDILKLCCKWSKSNNCPLNFSWTISCFTCQPSRHCSST